MWPACSKRCWFLVSSSTYSPLSHVCTHLESLSLDGTALDDITVTLVTTLVRSTALDEEPEDDVLDAPAGVLFQSAPFSSATRNAIAYLEFVYGTDDCTSVPEGEVPLATGVLLTIDTEEGV